MRIAVPLALALALMLHAAPAAACTPIWAYPGTFHEWPTVYVAKVTKVRWWSGVIEVEKLHDVKGLGPLKASIRYDNEPFNCGMQTFKRGETIFVFGERQFFATNLEYVDDESLLRLARAASK